MLQVLIENRYWTHIIPTLAESVTLLGAHTHLPNNSPQLIAIHGFDYVAHDDIIPYSTRDKAPIQHRLFDKFLAPRMSEDELVIFEAGPALKTFKEKYHMCFEITEVCRNTTDNIRITVIPFYLGTEENRKEKNYWVSHFSMLPIFSRNCKQTPVNFLKNVNQQ